MYIALAKFRYETSHLTLLKCDFTLYITHYNGLFLSATFPVAAVQNILKQNQGQ